MTDVLVYWKDYRPEKARIGSLRCHGSNPTLWLVAQATGEILPDGDKEKQLMQGLLNQREGLEEAARQRELF